MDRPKGDPAMVINRDMDILPARSLLWRINPAAGDSVTRAFKTAQLLDIQMQQVTGSIMLVSVVGPGWLQMG
jgi:hypothetical protein